jgi:hypothetical protein
VIQKTELFQHNFVPLQALGAFILVEFIFQVAFHRRTGR